MRLPKRRSMLLLVATVGAAALAGRPVATSVPSWTRVDLTQVDPVGGRPRDRHTEWRLTTIEPHDGGPLMEAGGTASQVAGIRQSANAPLVWRLRLGGHPYLGFTPFIASNNCAATGVVRVATRPGQWTEVWRGPALPVWPEAHEVDVSLDRWEGRAIELQLAVEGRRRWGGPCALQWSSPEIVMRTGTMPERAPHPEQPNIVVIGIDTLRADALGAWGRRPSVTPTLDALAAESDVWLQAYSTTNSTNSSFCSIHTGLYALHHGIHDLITPMERRHVTLAELLARRGYVTRALVSAHHLGRADLAQRFASWVLPDAGIFSARLTTNSAIDWLQQPQPRPFFLWLHLFDVHTPYLPPAPYSLGQRAGGVFGLGPVTSWVAFRPLGPLAFRDPLLGGHRDLYAGEVAFVDRQIDRLLATVAGRGYLRDTIVVVIADHGENLEEHGVAYRHAGLWDTTTHVPLMVRWPGKERRGRRFTGLVQTIDLFPTLLAAAGVPRPAQDGVPLAELTPGVDDRGRTAVFSEQIDGAGAAVRTARWRYFESRRSKIVRDGAYLYDLAHDPAETRNLAGTGLPAEAQLRSALDDWRRDSVRTRPGTMSAEEAAALHALGYD